MTLPRTTPKSRLTAICASMVLAFCLSCAAMPPAHRSFTVSAYIPPQSATVSQVDGINIYGANSANTNWVFVTSALATNGQTVAVSVPSYQFYTATSTFSGSESDYADMVATPPTPNAKVK